MTVVDFCRSTHGTGINQSKLYRKLRRFVEEHAEVDLYEEARRFEDYGFDVEEDGVGQLRYEIYDPEAFRVLAVHLASGNEEGLSPLERRDIVQALKNFVKAYRGEDHQVVLVIRGTGQPARGQFEGYFQRLDRLITKLS